MTELRVIPVERTPEPPSQIKLVAFDDIRLGTERRYLVEGLVPRVGLTVVWGPPKTGKSFWVFDLVMHVALGRSYRGLRVQSGVVIYCAFEGQTGIEARVEAFRQRFLAEEHEPIPFYLEPVTLDLVEAHGDLIDVIRQLSEPPAVVVLDTLNRSLRGSESSDQDMTAYVRSADALREAFGCAVIVVHHSGTDASRPRGHTALTGAADAQIAIKRDAADNIFATVELAKDGPEGKQIVSRLEVVQVGFDEDGLTIDSCVVVPAEGGVAPGRVLTVAAKRALEVLDRTLAVSGEPAAAGGRIPAGRRTILLSLWRSECEAATIASSDKPDSQHKAFVRASRKLQDLKYVDIFNERVWLLESVRTAET